MLVISLWGQNLESWHRFRVLNLLVLTWYRLGAPVPVKGHLNEAGITKHMFPIPYPAGFGTF